MSKFIPYLGGKRLLAKTILPLLPAHYLYCEPFGGSATILLGKDPSRIEVLNDLNGEIVNLFRVIQHHPEEFLRLWELNLRSREEFERLKQCPPRTLTDVQRAIRTFYLIRAGYGGKLPEAGCHFVGRMAGRPFAIYDIDGVICDVHRRLAGVTIEHLPYNDCLRRYDGPESLFYCDPPYYGHEQDYGAGLFGREDFANLQDVLSGLQGRFLLSLNDTPEVRDLFGSFHLQEVTTTYSAGTKSGAGKTAKELLIANYPLPASHPKGEFTPRQPS